MHINKRQVTATAHAANSAPPHIPPFSTRARSHVAATSTPAPSAWPTIPEATVPLMATMDESQDAQAVPPAQSQVVGLASAASTAGVACSAANPASTTQLIMVPIRYVKPPVASAASGSSVKPASWAPAKG